MGIFILIFSFLFIFFSFLFTYGKKEDILDNLRTSFLKAVLVISLFVVLVTEVLSRFDAIVRAGFLVVWSLMFLVSGAVFVALLRKNNYSFSSLNLERVLCLFKNGMVANGIIFLLLIILITSFAVDFTITNHWDTYTYHMPRVEHWIQDKNVEFYPTDNPRQLFMGAVSEYYFLSIIFLSGSYVFLSLVQFFAMISSLMAVSLIVKSFKLTFWWQLFSVVLVVTIPMGMLQALTTQTDYVTSAFLLIFVYFGLRMIKEEKLSYGEIFFFSASFALGIFTKATFYIFALPFCIFFGAYFLILFRKNVWSIAFLLMAIFLLVNANLLYRNFQQYGSPLGPRKTDAYYLTNLNSEFGMRNMLSNTVKNFGMHLGLPNDDWNHGVDRKIEWIHGKILKLPVNYGPITWYHEKYGTPFMVHHELMGNFAHTILFFIVIATLFFWQKVFDRKVFYYGLSLSGSYLLFAFLLVWQPWQTRLDLPFFVALSPLSTIVFAKMRWKKISVALSITLLFLAISILYVFSLSKPILGDYSVFKKSNSDYIFGYQAAMRIRDKLAQNQISNVGLILKGESWEWQYWLLAKNVRFEHVYFSRDFLKTKNYDPNFTYGAMIVKSDSNLSDEINNFMAKDDNIKQMIVFPDLTRLIIFKNPRNDVFVY